MSLPAPPPKLTRDHSSWNALFTVLRNTGPYPQWKHRRISQLWSAAPEVEKLVWVSEAKDRKLLQFRPTSCEQAKSRCPYIPGSLRTHSTESPKPKVNISGEMHDPPQTVVTSYRSWPQQYSSPTPTMSVITLLLPSPTDQVSPGKWLLASSFIWVQGRHWRVTFKQRWLQNQNSVLVSK